jgi:heme O synthase-like polyprenyltransferase
MPPASHGAHMRQIGRTVALLKSHASFGDLVALMKPRVMSLVVFTALVGLLVAPGHLDPLLGFVALLCITAGAGAAGVLNMWYDADIDALMTRTAMRPIPRGRVSRAEALAFGLVLAACSIAVLGFAVNIAAAALLAFTIFFYVVVYTMWLKRQTPQNIVIGGAAGAFPPVIGWVAATGRIGVDPLILFLTSSCGRPPFLGAVAQSCWRILPCRHPNAAGCGWYRRNKAADSHLLRLAGADFDPALRTRTCWSNLRRDCRHVRCGDDSVCNAAVQKQ